MKSVNSIADAELGDAPTRDSRPAEPAQQQPSDKPKTTGQVDLRIRPITAKAKTNQELLKSTDQKAKEVKDETILKARFKPPTTQKMIENRQMQEKIRLIKKDLENQLRMPAH